MYTPPVTKLKGDLLLELRDIKLDIAKEKSKLEEIIKKSNELNAGFEEREKEIKKKEHNNKILHNKYSLLFNDADEKLKEKKAEMFNCNKSIDRQNKLIAENERLIAGQSEKLRKAMEEVENSISSKTNYVRNLEIDINNKERTQRELREELKELVSKRKELRESNESISIDLKNRIHEVEEKEKWLERKKSDLRVYSVRLHQKYGKLMTEAEKKLTTINT